MRFFRDTRGSAGLFSVLTLLALVLSIGYTAGLADATLARMKVQDAADAAAYSGARVRGNLYALMGFLNMAKVCLYRRHLGMSMYNQDGDYREGEAAVLMELGRISGIPVDPALLSGSVIGVGETVAEKAYRYAVLADNLQLYIEENFLDIIESEIQLISREHGCELLVLPSDQNFLAGGNPAFGPEDDPKRYWSHWEQMARWRGYDRKFEACGIFQPVWYEEDLEDEAPEGAPVPDDPWTPRIISANNSMTHKRNAIKVVLEETAHESVFLPKTLKSHHDTVMGTATAGCFSESLRAQPAYENLYTTDFRGKLLSLQSAQFYDWLYETDPALLNRLPYVPELIVH